MNDRVPALLTVLVETGTRRWFVAGITLDGQPIPLVCSEAGNLDPYVGAGPDEQLNFLRHRLSGVLQRGCDRLWGRSLKPCHIVFVVDADFEPGNPALTRHVAQHFVTWMSQPPVVFYASRHGFRPGGPLALDPLAGALDEAGQHVLLTGLPQLFAAAAEADRWELAPSKNNPPGAM